MILSDESKSGPNIIVVTKFLFALIGTLIPVSITITILDLVPFLSAQLKAQATILSALCFFAGSMAVLFSKPSIQKALIWLSGFIIAVGAAVIAGTQILFLTAVTYPTETLMFIGVPALIIVVLILQRLPEAQEAVKDSPLVEVISSKIVKGGQTLIGGVELSEFPESHMSKTTDQTTETSWYHPFYKILRIMTLARAPLALRVERVKSKNEGLEKVLSQTKSDLVDSKAMVEELTEIKVVLDKDINNLRKELTECKQKQEALTVN